METGVITLTNTKQYPFNDSAKTVALKSVLSDNKYFVWTETTGAEGDAGKVRIYDKAMNGFRIAFTGPAKSADIRYLVVGDSEADESNV